jgi:hypothetical protein
MYVVIIKTLSTYLINLCCPFIVYNKSRKEAAITLNNTFLNDNQIRIFIIEIGISTRTRHVKILCKIMMVQ